MRPFVVASLRGFSWSALTVLGALLVACGDDGGGSAVDTDTDTGSSSSGGSGSPTSGPAESSTTDDSTSGGPVTSSTTDPGTSSSTGPAVDEPPTVTLQVAGSAKPEALDGADLVPLVAEAADDNAVARVEFFRDGELLSTDEEAPFEAEVLLTSLDNADVEFHAVAYDDAEQSGTSETVTLEVAVIGANIQHVATDVLEAGGFSYQPGGGVMVVDDGTVFVATSTLDADVNGFGLRAAQVSADLSTVAWERRVPEVAVEDGEQLLVTGEPVLFAADGRFVIAGTGFDNDSNTNTAMLVGLTLDGNSATTVFEEPGPDETEVLNIPGAVAGPAGDVILHGPGPALTRLMGPNTVWQVPAPGFDVSALGATHMSSDAAGDVLLDTLVCGKACTWTVSKRAGADGATLWERETTLNASLSDFHVGASVTAPNGDVLLAYGEGEDGGDIRLVRWGADGSDLGSVTVDSGDAAFTVSDVEFDAQGQIVVLGSRIQDTDADANLLRLTPDGAVLWQRSFGFGTDRDLSLAFTLDRRGRVVMAGLADPETGFLLFAASLWLAIVDL